MAQNIIENPEWQNFMQQYSGGQPPQPTEPEFVPQVPQATQGPLMANAPQPAFDTLAAQPLDIAAAAPSPVQVASAPMEGASQFNVPDPVQPEVPSSANLSPMSLNLVPSMTDPLAETGDFAGTGTGAFIDPRASDVGGFAGIEEGLAEAVGRPTTTPSAQPAVQAAAPEATAATPTTQESEVTMQPPSAGSPQANFEARKATGKQFTPEEISQAEALAKSTGTTFDPKSGYSRQPFMDAQETQEEVPMTGMRPINPTTGEPASDQLIAAAKRSGVELPEASVPTVQPQTSPPASLPPMGVDETKARLGEIFGEAPQTLSEVTQRGQQLDPQGRMIDPTADRSGYEKAVADREAGTFSPAGSGRAVSDRERRAARGEGISMADRTDMAKANVRGASPKDIARGQEIADELGVDLATGQPPETEVEKEKTAYETKLEGLDIEQRKANLAKTNAQIADIITSRNPDAETTDYSASQIGAIQDVMKESNLYISDDGKLMKDDWGPNTELNPGDPEYDMIMGTEVGRAMLGKGAPKAGTVKNGYRFKGGDPADKNNWEKV